MVIDPAFPGFRDEFMKVSAAGSACHWNCRSVRSRKNQKPGEDHLSGLCAVLRAWPY
jgi:hypothetical protein